MSYVRWPAKTLSFWRAFKTQQSNVCLVELAAQIEAFRALMGSQPAQIPEQADLLGTSVRAADASCLNAPITADELHDCIKHLKRNKSPGTDGVLSEMIKDGGAAPAHARRTTAAQNALHRTRKTHRTHPKNQAHPRQNYSTSTDA